MTTETKHNRIADQIVKAAQAGNTDLIDTLAEALVDLGRQSGKDDLLIDLVDANEISAEGVEFAIENNGCTDPRK